MTSEQLPSDPLIHRVCQFIRDEMAPLMSCSGLACQKCPTTEDTPYGPGTRACVLRAKELIEITRSGS